MSLTIDLRLPGGGKEITVDHIGQVVKLEAWGTVKGNNPDSTDGIQSGAGSVLSTNVGGGSALGDLSAAPTAPFNASGSTPAAQADLDSDGDLDAGSNDNPSAEGFLSFRSSSVTTNGEPAPGGGAQFKLADVQFVVTSLLGGTETQLNYRPRQGGTNISIALWKEDGVFRNIGNGTLLVGNPVIVHSSGVSTTQSLRGSVYDDKNANGRRDVGEPALSNWGVYLDLNKNGVRDAVEPTALTNSSGVYAFTSLASGTYRVRELLYAGYRRVTPDVGYYDAKVGSTGVTGVNPFGNTKLGFISGTVFKDANGNGRRDASEVGLSGFRVWDDIDGDGAIDANEPSALTDSGGRYTLNVQAGWHTIRVRSELGYRQTGASYYRILTGDSTRVYDKLFGEKQLS